MNILIVEDEVKLAEIERDYLIQSGYEVSLLHRGDEVAEWLQTNTADLIVLDIMLPGLDGMEICREIRRKDDNMGIIMATARVDEIDRLLGLELGADDYLCKPFSPRELVARVKAVLRRYRLNRNNQDTENVDDLTLLDQTNCVKYRDRIIELTSVEFQLLNALKQKAGKILSRDQLMNLMYQDNRIVSDRTIDSHIKKLRKKIQALDDSREFVRSVYGAGYKYE
ncbi:response regulator [Gynuella sunshinyii]|uniref:Response regulator consisting of a CheY-like receiver domain and a winged-helix DNA-binding domain n=1 Tax=Gynuella sunshinyii YC6258 TaxID=1445510 RepID=A0A0C5VQU5_9GAMM|nr:response regulator [Gynuella sunshinyii]AJQ92634.1 response regulator consisting of a CheY-like receiver domain and a winged-helix DNA-binding domain [Gynuella sunshinyii YC6258]